MTVSLLIDLTKRFTELKKNEIIGLQKSDCPVKRISFCYAITTLSAMLLYQ